MRALKTRTRNFDLVTDLPRMLLPSSKCRKRFLAHHLSHWNLTLCVRLGEFIVNGRIIKADFRGVRSEVAKKDSIDTSPVDRAQAHGAGLTGSVELTSPEVETAKFLACPADRKYFSVGGRVVQCRNLIRTFRYDAPFPDDDSAKRSAASAVNILQRKFNGASHESLVSVSWFRHRVVVFKPGGISGQNKRANCFAMFLIFGRKLLEWRRLAVIVNIGDKFSGLPSREFSHIQA